jgi:ribosome-binding protein aMBF1 (putative translation factor)
MLCYPSLEAAHREWEALQSVPTPNKPRSRARVKPGGDIELGKQIKDARLKLKLSKRELGAKIFKFKAGGKECISGKSIEGYENGYIMPPKKILEQLKQILGLEIEKNGMS